MKRKNFHLDRQFIIVNTSAWLLVFALTVSESLFFYQINGKPAPYRNIIVNDLYILCWIIITPFLFMITRFWYHHRTKWLSFVFKILAVGALAMAVIIGLETTVHFFDRLNTEQERAWTNMYIQLISFRFQINLLLYLGYSAISVAALAYFEIKKSEEKRRELNRSLIEAQLGVLKAQMKPHFLFNSLHAISGLILKKQNELAITVITKLSDLLRDSLNMDEKKWITLNEEIDFINRYLEIYVLRFGKQLTYSFEVKEGTELALVPPALLQPIVENSLVHGIVPNDNQGHININARIKENYLEIEVCNNLQVNKISQEQQKEGIGLSNTRKRLSSLYADDFEFSFELSESKGASTIIVLPLSNNKI
ncbi:histidine kinase [Reichenbachiella sp.]|uniref:sensor histidine kinase n=1 Tax=Reichenbachiella sp. TaxID=2184521 RepID=UPI003297D833